MDGVISTAPRRLGIPLATALWSVVVVGGMAGLCKYELTPGESSNPPTQWPAGSTLTLNQNRPTLILFAHPRCPCTRATIGELERIMARCQGKVDARVMFFVPSHRATEWKITDLWDSAHRIPGVTVVEDVDNVEAKRFGAQTSGHVQLFDPLGRLKYSGGITLSRGHSGDNPGHRTVVALINGKRADAARFPVFGCPLYTHRASDG